MMAGIIEDCCSQTPLGIYNIFVYILVVSVMYFPITALGFNWFNFLFPPTYFWFLQNIMHNEELGLLKREISSLYDSLSEADKKKLDSRIQSMPVVPNFPRITVSLSKPSIFKAKHWITISKYICCAIHGVLSTTIT